MGEIIDGIKEGIELNELRNKIEKSPDILFSIDDNDDEIKSQKIKEALSNSDFVRGILVDSACKSVDDVKNMVEFLLNHNIKISNELYEEVVRFNVYYAKYMPNFDEFAKFNPDFVVRDLIVGFKQVELLKKLPIGLQLAYSAKIMKFLPDNPEFLLYVSKEFIEKNKTKIKEWYKGIKGNKCEHLKEDGEER